jgi:Acetylornithine deacetylase/Succinyl-diaminopimelate desuccinylase and related deacylases
VARLAGADEKLPICFTGDVDTVPLGVSPRGQDAFAGETHGDKLYGRGTSDMKSGVAAMTVMALRLAKISHRRAGMMLIFTAGGRDHLRGRLCRDCKSLVWSLGNKEPKYDDD